MEPAARFRALIDRLTKQFAEEEVPGVVWDFDEGAIDDGDYGSPEVERRPDFIQQDTRGWKALW